MKRFTFMILLLLASSGCNGQDKTKKYSYHKTDSTAVGQPQVSWRVNKEVDNKGNIIKYDSTYVWSYSNKGTSEKVRVDSVMAMFRNRFDTQFRNVFRQSFGDPVWNDSLFYKTFIDPDYFMHKWKNNELNMNKFMMKMDSSRNAFLKENYPGLESSVKRK